MTRHDGGLRLAKIVAGMLTVCKLQQVVLEQKFEPQLQGVHSNIFPTINLPSF